MSARNPGRMAALALAAALALGACAGEEAAPKGEAPSLAAPAPGYSQEKPAPSATEAPSYQPEVPDVAQLLRQSRRRNPDTVGWLYIPDTAINEPVLQTSDNDYYRFHDGEKNYRESGSVFVDYECTLGDGRGGTFSQNTILYGHNLGNPRGVKDDPQGERFAQLMHFTDETFAGRHPYFFFITEQGVQTYEIFAVAYLDANTEPVSYILPEYPAAAFSLLIEDMKRRSLYDYGVPVGGEDKVMTLSCCSHKYGSEKENPYQRFVVMGRLMEDGQPRQETAHLRRNGQPKEPDFTKYSTEITPDERIAALNWQNLGGGQMAEDFDALFKTLEENYPYLQSLEQRLGMTRQELYQKLRPQIAATGSDGDFYTGLHDLLSGTFKGLGGLRLEDDPYRFPELAGEYQARAGESRLISQLSALYNSAQAQESYQKLGEPYGLIDTYRSVYSQMQYTKTSWDYRPAPARPQNPALPQNLRSNGNVQAGLYEDGRIAYIRIPDLSEERIGPDRDFLLDFYRQAAGAQSVILDLCGSTGDSREYVDGLLLAPNIREPLTLRYWQLSRAGEQNSKFFDFSDPAWRPVSELPRLFWPGGGIGGFTHARMLERRVEPAGPGPGGRLYLLTDGRGERAARYAATMMKNGSLATLIGTRPASGGLEEEPAALALPQSGWIVRYSADYTLLPNGSCSNLSGARPDVAVDPAKETPLAACLRVISEGGGGFPQ
ncbi:MAG: hypothetical protein DBX66_07980 [Clostridiales bacterium]|nr:MAG: hypothetical protein DBX66_07980 [Clostridiales bacterium]